jgi:hypothetical protein
MARIQEWAICLYSAGNGFWEAKNSATNGWSANRKLFWAKYRSGKFDGASHSIKSSAPRALAGVKNGRLTLRATAGYCFSPLFGLLSASRDFAALHTSSLKARGTKGDSGNFPRKTRLPRNLGFKSPLFCNFLFPAVPFTSKEQDQARVHRALCVSSRGG